MQHNYTMQPLKTFLGQYQSVLRQIENETEHMVRIREKLEAGRNAGLPDGMPHGGGNSDMADAICSLIDLEKRVATRLKYLVTLRDDIERLIGEANDIQQDELMRYRYLDGMTWETIAERMHVDVRTVYRIHGNALTAIQKSDRYAAFTT